MTVFVDFWDHATRKEIGLQFYATCTPRVGEIVHYWQDGDEHSAAGVYDRRDYVVREVVHDFRFMPARSEKSCKYIHSVIIFVIPVEDAA